MWSSRSSYFFKPLTFSKRSTPFIDQEFQVRYTLLLLGAAFLGIVLTLIPIYFFINQNYKIFFDLAYDHAPQLLDHLERERIWINTTLFGVFLGLLVFFTILGFRMTARIVGPLKVLSNHLRHLSRGQWYIPTIKVRDNDEFQELIESYNYFYSSFQSQIDKDLVMLKKIIIDPSQREALYAWMDMMQEKAAQVNKPVERFIPGIDGTPAGARGSRHVS